MLNKLAVLIMLHLLYDFHWQGPFIGEQKRKSFFFLFIHALTYGLTLYVGALFVSPIGAYSLLMLVGTHFAIDLIKVSLDKGAPGGLPMYLDQLAHLVVLVVVFFIPEGV